MGVFDIRGLRKLRFRKISLALPFKQPGAIKAAGMVACSRPALTEAPPLISADTFPGELSNKSALRLAHGWNYFISEEEKLSNPGRTPYASLKIMFLKFLLETSSSSEQEGRVWNSWP